MLRNAVLALLVALLTFSASRALAADVALAKQWVDYGQKQYAARQYDAAIKAFSTAARANSADASAWKGMGYAYYAKGDKANAVKYSKYAVQLNPADTALAQWVQKLEASTSAAGQASASDPMVLAGKYYQARQYDYAIWAYNKAIAANPNNAKAYQGLGNAYNAKKDKVNAVNAYKRAIELDPTNTALASYLATYAPGSTDGATAAAAAGGPSDWVQPLWRSAILPGWGQGYNGQTVKGWILGLATVGALGGTVGTYVIGSGARERYKGYTQPTDDYDGAYGQWESMANLNHIFAIVFGVAYTFNIVDAIIGAKPKAAYGFIEKDPALELALNRTGGVTAKYRLLEF